APRSTGPGARLRADPPGCSPDLVRDPVVPPVSTPGGGEGPQVLSGSPRQEATGENRQMAIPHPLLVETSPRRRPARRLARRAARARAPFALGRHYHRATRLAPAGRPAGRSADHAM